MSWWRSAAEKALLKYGIAARNGYFSDAAGIVGGLSEKYGLEPDEILKMLKENPRESNPQFRVRDELIGMEREITENEDEMDELARKVDELRKKMDWVGTVGASAEKKPLEALGSAADSVVRMAVLMNYESRMSGLVEKLEQLEQRNNELEGKIGRARSVLAVTHDFENKLRNFALGGDGERKGAELIQKFLLR